MEEEKKNRENETLKEGGSESSGCLNKGGGRNNGRGLQKWNNFYSEVLLNV